MEIAKRLEPGQRIGITMPDMYLAADCMLRSALDGPAKRSDVLEFVEKAEANWGVEFTENILTDDWTMERPEYQQ